MERSYSHNYLEPIILPIRWLHMLANTPTTTDNYLTLMDEDTYYIIKEVTDKRR